ncbi:unnamed protein product [Periconia digitata]|uniref:Uncharacterized protein n=1 Tax=Periconia digitata TaxID=1303443 RepID=A0A9W4UDP0_9PLEO|nr:unnamed protein product [Periconia digitata]
MHLSDPFPMRALISLNQSLTLTADFPPTNVTSPSRKPAQSTYWSASPSSTLTCNRHFKPVSTISHPLEI